MNVMGCVGAPGSQRSTLRESSHERSTASLSANRPPEQASEPHTINILGSGMAR